jgi:hypothetical protein
MSVYETDAPKERQPHWESKLIWVMSADGVELARVIPVPGVRYLNLAEGSRVMVYFKKHVGYPSMVRITDVIENDESVQMTVYRVVEVRQQ